jgi:hypothetical protein
MKQGKVTPCSPKGESRRERALERKAALTSGVRGHRLAFLPAGSLDNCCLKDLLKAQVYCPRPKRLARRCRCA